VWKELGLMNVGVYTGKGLAQAIFGAKLFPVYPPIFIKPGSFHTHLPAYEDGRECSETSAYKIQTHGNYPKEIIQHSEHGESLKSRTNILCHFQL
jgi:hypothetical protein